MSNEWEISYWIPDESAAQHFTSLKYAQAVPKHEKGIYEHTEVCKYQYWLLTY